MCMENGERCYARWLSKDHAPKGGSDSHLMSFLPSLRFSKGESAPCEPVFEFRRLYRVGWLSRA